MALPLTGTNPPVIASVTLALQRRWPGTVAAVSVTLTAPPADGHATAAGSGSQLAARPLPPGAAAAQPPRAAARGAEEMVNIPAGAHVAGPAAQLMAGLHSVKKGVGSEGCNRWGVKVRRSSHNKASCNLASCKLQIL